ncbi:DUF3578 domain-containing protein [Fictibacillus nanhaiensis]|uniref:DUF3578 domain-containing protein n=1 Tax=Fictibacillus nanhaiensis TaxID=742169 RepID=A0ABS2ZT46_9BACL|nr:DUF3578 domain-containing protein [Fictibacillus nanhaiensis]
MRDWILNILEGYSDLTKLSFKPTSYDLSNYITRSIPEIIASDLQLNINEYKVEASVGAGKWTGTPWVSIFDREITESAMKGFYIVYLFRRDLKGVYLSLNQGTTYISTKYKNRKPRGKMTEIANKVRETLNYSSADFPTEDIHLASNTPNSKNYETAHICGKYYPANDIPNESELISDLHSLLQIYKQLKIQMGNRTTDEIIDYLLNKEVLEDTQFQTDILLSPPSSTPRRPISIPSMQTSNGSNKWKRNAAIAKEAIVNAKYVCEINPTHQTFVSNISGENFVEGHHLIPINLQKHFKWSLDVPGNIVSLCPNCHRQIHHARKADINDLLERLYYLKSEILNDYGLNISLFELKNMY